MTIESVTVTRNYVKMKLMWLCSLLILQVVPMMANSFRYEGVLDVPERGRLCYWAPFKFSELEGIHWYLSVADEEEKSCLLGGHPDANSSLWQVSSDGRFWFKRDGRKFDIVRELDEGNWGWWKEMALPDEIENPHEVILWSNSSRAMVLWNGTIWSSDLEEVNWEKINGTPLSLKGFTERGFVQTESYLFYWGNEASLLIDKRSGRIQRYLDDNWPSLLQEFETLGTEWIVEGDFVRVGNGMNEVRFGLSQKANLSRDFLFQGLEDPLEAETVDGDEGLLFEVLTNPVVCIVLGLLIGGLMGSWFRWWSAKHKVKAAAAGEPLQKSALGKEGSLMGASVAQHFSLGVSPEFETLALRTAEVLSTEEFDVLIGNELELSPESLRSRRSKAIRSINSEAQLVLGYDLIERERDLLDRRKVTYRIRPVPPRIINSIQSRMAASQGDPVKPHRQPQEASRPS